MGNIRQRDGKLFFDFRFCGERCREQTSLPDNASNRKRMQKVLEKIEAAIALGSFRYSDFFPGSKLAMKFEAQNGAESTPTSVNKPEDVQPQSDTPSYQAFADVWLMENEPLWRRSHLATVRSTLEHHLIPAFGHVPVGQITKAECLSFRAQLAKLPGRNGKASLAAKTINRVMAIHGQVLSEAAERFNFPNPTLRIKRLKQQKIDIAPFSLVEVQAILAAVREDYRNYLVVRFFTGMRTGEINGLQWKHVDFDRRVIQVRQAIVRGQMEYTKTDGSQRDITMSQPVYEALIAQRQRIETRSPFVFCNQAGEPIDLDNFTNRVWYPLLRYLQLDARRPYQTRHTAATLWLAAGENPEWVARQLGHTNTEMLFKTYSRYVPNVTRTDGSAMDRLLAANLNSAPVVILRQRDLQAPHMMQPHGVQA
ncbi:MAG: site-specific integrase [Thermomonas sp.]|uniref:Arm DNA-binding domain-containing protein n=1 Tax=Thermomonas sp. TaxID=1971895 RepID=UPI001EB83130|nr:DUF3596 domain-containing protein [Thermomonas sp.]MBV2208937.1 site-specific integrase [Thermomonas sp.]